MNLFIKPAALLALIIALGGCTKDNHTTPKITAVKHTNSTGVSFSPLSSINYSAVTITGNFSTIPGENVVKFNGVTGIINSVTATQIVVTVPASATTGKISVITNGITTTTAADFKVLKMVKTTVTIPGAENLGGFCFDGLGNTYAEAYPDYTILSSGSAISGQVYFVKIKPDGQYSVIYKPVMSPGLNEQYEFGAMTVDASGNIYTGRRRILTDQTEFGVYWDRMEILKIQPDGTMSIFAGGARASSSGFPVGYVDGPSTQATFDEVIDLAVKNNTVYVLDLSANAEGQYAFRLRKITDGYVSTILDPLPDTNYGGFLRQTDKEGQLYFFEFGQLKKMDAKGAITIVAGKNSQYGATDGSADIATFARNIYVQAVDSEGNVFSAASMEQGSDLYSMRITNSAGYTSTIPFTINNLQGVENIFMDKANGRLIIANNNKTLTYVVFK